MDTQGRSDAIEQCSFPVMRHIVPGVEMLGSYQPGKSPQEVLHEFGVHDAIKLASNENSLGPSSSAIEAFKQASHELARYPDGHACGLREALAVHYGIERERILTGHGSNELFELTARVLLRPGDNVVVSRHAFVMYELVSTAAGAEVRAAPSRDHSDAMPLGHDPDSMFALIDARTRVVFIANPNNPTGTWLSEKELLAFLERVPPSVLVVVDEAYAEYATVPGFGSALRWLNRFPNLLITRTFSKAYGLAALRIGYGIGHPDLMERFDRARQPFNLNMPAQKAALAALADTDHLERSIHQNSEQKNFMLEQLGRLSIQSLPSAANFLSIFLDDSERVYEYLMQSGVIVRSLKSYGLVDYLRVTIGLAEENERFLHALQQAIQT